MLKLTTLILALTALSAHAETKEQAITKAQNKAAIGWEKKTAKAELRKSIKAKYQPKLDAIKEQMKAEIDAALEKCNATGCGQ